MSGNGKSSAWPWVLGLGALAVGGVVYAAHRAPEAGKKPDAGAGKPDAKPTTAGPPPPTPQAGAGAPAASAAPKAGKARAAGAGAGSASPGLPPGFTPPPGASAKVGLESIPTKGAGPSGPTDTGPASTPASAPAQGDPGYMPEGGGSGDSYVKVTEAPAAGAGGILDDFAKGADSLWKDVAS